MADWHEMIMDTVGLRSQLNKTPDLITVKGYST